MRREILIAVLGILWGATLTFGAMGGNRKQEVPPVFPRLYIPATTSPDNPTP
jgi:hypothetical protein